MKTLAQRLNELGQQSPVWFLLRLEPGAYDSLAQILHRDRSDPWTVHRVAQIVIPQDGQFVPVEGFYLAAENAVPGYQHIGYIVDSGPKSWTDCPQPHTGNAVLNYLYVCNPAVRVAGDGGKAVGPAFSMTDFLAGLAQVEGTTTVQLAHASRPDPYRTGLDDVQAAREANRARRGNTPPTEIPVTGNGSPHVIQSGAATQP